MTVETSVATDPIEPVIEPITPPVNNEPVIDGKATYTKEEVDALIGKKRSANKEAETYRKKNEALEAKLKVIEDANKTEAEKILDERNSYKLELETSRRDNAMLSLKNAAISHGVQDQYSDYVATSMEEASKAEGFDQKVWLDKHKENNKAFWKNGVTALGSGQGGQTNAPPLDAKAAQIEQLKKQIAETKDKGLKHSYGRRIRQLEGKLEYRNTLGG